MTSRSSLGRAARAVVGAAILASTVLACGPAMPGGVPSPTPPGSLIAPPPGTPTTSPTPTATTVPPSPSLAGRDAPPDAVLAAEGGDPVTGQLGTYIWLETGSDAPWLPGAPLTVGAGEPLTMRLIPDGDIRGWAARYVPAGAQGPDGATILAEGTGTPAFDAPGTGAWTLEVSVEFSGAAGRASYFWRLEVE
jgi:hypothetical protein